MPPPTAPAQATNHQVTSQPASAPPGLQEPLVPGQPIKRVDTQTKDLDEFVDAKPL